MIIERNKIRQSIIGNLTKISTDIGIQENRANELKESKSNTEGEIESKSKELKELERDYQKMINTKAALEQVIKEHEGKKRTLQSLQEDLSNTEKVINSFSSDSQPRNYQSIKKVIEGLKES